MASATVLLQSPFGAMVETRGVLASYWTRSWDLPLVQRFNKIFSDVRARQPRGVSTLMVFRIDGLDARAFGDQPTRKALTDLQTEFNPYFREAAIVLEGSGFAAAALRSSAWAVSQVVRVKHVPRYYDTELEAARQLVRANADLALVEAEVRDAAALARSAAAEVK